MPTRIPISKPKNRQARNVTIRGITSSPIKDSAYSVNVHTGIGYLNHVVRLVLHSDKAASYSTMNIMAEIMTAARTVLGMK